MNNNSFDPDSLNEEYYQVSPEILDCFPKFRLPLNLYQYSEKIAQLAPFYTAETRLHQEQQREMLQLSRAGHLFVSRADHKIYARHISRQLDMVLMDNKLTAEEIVYIFRYALTDKINGFYDQPVKPALDKLKSDVLVLTQYLTEDLSRINGLLGYLHNEYSHVNLAYNAGITGLAVYIDIQGKDLKRKTVDQLALGLFTHVLGLTRVPAFILEKKTNLSREEKAKLVNYPMTGAGVMRKLDVLEDVVLNCHLEHKELMDGTGLPRGIKGNETSLYGKIAAAVHAFFELSMVRNDKAVPADKVLEYLIKAESKYDTRITKRMNRVLLDLTVR